MEVALLVDADSVWTYQNCSSEAGLGALAKLRDTILLTFAGRAGGVERNVVFKEKVMYVSIFYFV